MQCQISSAHLPGVGWMALDVLQAQGHSTNAVTIILHFYSVKSSVRHQLPCCSLHGKSRTMKDYSAIGKYREGDNLYDNVQ